MQPLEPVSKTRFVAPPPPLQRYLTTYYFSEIESPDESEISDLILPQWASIRYIYRGSVKMMAPDQKPQDSPRAAMTGPTSLAAPISSKSAHIAAFGLLPLGWYKFVGQPASRWANKVIDTEAAHKFELFAEIWNAIRNLEFESEMVDTCNHLLLEAMAPADPEEELIEAAHLALTDPMIDSVGALCERLDMDAKQLSRFSNRVFGFLPKLLLRRQRFVRTLGEALMNPSQSWSECVDLNYYDQAHFNRDFKRFMGLTPRQYMAQPHPIFGIGARERTKALGRPLQAMDRPEDPDSEDNCNAA
ncbi:helix-turn-helix domain-containing protein [Parasphingorhabdus cellanae]|uniref:AraC family transcriptional regulator n=1 Tax=Parasphingorhabdus cellanae TaxID=2806553 RepID=A0ABX7SZW0_9SPHN|nr:helix-turn-helix domain-containing protein [Parasphingorhabdus cellanae]QTD54826.1 AraC family transcriptional regulator [Parasphingorhabdus cellanae]